MDLNNRRIHFKKLWHKVAVIYSLIIVTLFFLFFFFFERTLIKYFEKEQVYKYEKSLERFNILVKKKSSYSELEKIIKSDELLKDYHILIYDKDYNSIMGDLKYQELLDNTSNIKTSKGIIVDRIENNTERDYWVFEELYEDKLVYFIKNIDEVSNFYTKVISLIIIFATALSFIFALLSFITSKWLLKPIFEILDNENNIDLNSAEKLNINNYSEDELRRIVKLKNNFIIKVRDFVDREKRFVANASHELLTPITVIKGYSEVLRWGRDDEKIFTDALNAIEDESNRMENLMNSLLLLSKIDRVSSATFKNIELEAVLTKEIKLLKTAYKREIKLLGGPVYINGSIDLILQSVRELIKNAVKYSSDDIVIEILAVDSFGVIKVRDRGQGISEEFVHNIFDRFSQEDTSKTSKGYGLGLSIVKEITDLHKGHILINSTLGLGTTVIIKIPITK